MRKQISALCFLSLMIALPLSAQKGLYIGPTIGGGGVISNNFIIPSDSPYYIKNSPGFTGFGSIDVMYGITERASVSIGGSYIIKQFNLTPPNNPSDLSFSTLSKNIGIISIPAMVHYRLPLGKSETYFRASVGHRINFLSGDSSDVLSPGVTGGVVPAGTAVSRQVLIEPKSIYATVLLGAGVDFEFRNDNVLTIGLLWEIGTGRIFEGSIKEWPSLRNDFNTLLNEEPQEFPKYYYEFALRGGSINLRASYYFYLGDPFKRKKKK